MRIKAPAKINLTLELTCKMPNGYHGLESVMQSVGLYDILTINKQDSGITISSNSSTIPLDNTNIAFKAAQLFLQSTNINVGLEIHIDKSIPVQAGMGGGSTDAAAVLKGLNHMFDYVMDDSTLYKTGLTLGADVPFCLMGGTALAKGIGERLVPVENNSDIWIVIIKPPFGISTAKAFSKVNANDFCKTTKSPYMIQALKNGSPAQVSKYLINDLYKPSLGINPELEKYRQLLISAGALNAVMTGSGSALYGVYQDKESALNAKNYLEKDYVVYAVPLLKGGIEFID